MNFDTLANWVSDSQQRIPLCPNGDAWYGVNDGQKSVQRHQDERIDRSMARNYYHILNLRRRKNHRSFRNLQYVSKDKYHAYKFTPDISERPWKKRKKNYLKIYRIYGLCCRVRVLPARENIIKSSEWHAWKCIHSSLDRIILSALMRSHRKLQTADQRLPNWRPRYSLLISS